MSSPVLRSASPTATLGPEPKLSSKNPVSVRLYKVLGTNLDDHATREALQTLSDLYVTPPPASKEPVPAGVEGRSYQDPRPDASPTSAAGLGPVLEESVPGESAARARKNLRRDMETKLTNASKQFLEAFGEVDQKLDELQKHVTEMRISCDEAERQLAIAAEASGTLLERAGSLREERQEVENKKSIVMAFLAKFTLNEEEVEAIISRDVPVGQHFFAAMDKTARIRDDCRILMAGEDGPTQAGLDIMAATSPHLEQGYEKISRWCSHEFLRLGRDFHLEASAIMREAVKRLQQRPELLTEALTDLLQTRQATLLSSFITALTRGGPSGLPRPIELHAHDPMRYVGDMLAWVHQTVAAEQEFLEALFGMQYQRRMVGSVRTFEGKTEEEEWVKELMNSCVAKLCMPLKARVQQTIQSQESCIVSYKIANLLQFYMLTIHRTIGDKALLSRTLLEITDIAYTMFYESITAQARALTRVPPVNATSPQRSSSTEPFSHTPLQDVNDLSLGPSLTILDHAQILKEIMTVYQSSLGDEDDDERIAGFEKILDIMVDPAIDMCTRENEEKKRLRPRWDEPVFVINCLSYLESILEPFSFTRHKQTWISILIEDRVSRLTNEHYHDIMADAGLIQVVETCKSRGPNEPLSRLSATQPYALQSALRTFSIWLSGLEVVESPRLQHLTAQRLHTRIHHAALERMARAYKFVCEEVRKPENRYEAAATLLGSERPFGQAHLLKQIFGLEESSLEAKSS